MSTIFNTASYVSLRAKETPSQIAVVMPEGYNAIGKRTYSHMTFAQLDVLCDSYAAQFLEQGIEPGMRVLSMVRQGLELVGITFALFKIGAVPVLIDPGMGIKSFTNCVAHCEPDAMVGIPVAHVVRVVFRGKFKSIKKSFITEPKWWTSANVIRADFESNGEELCEIMPTQGDDLAAILFTSGSTGPPKGVHYTHNIFRGQTESIQKMYNIQPGEIAVPGFPLFAIFSVAMGMVCAIPDMDPKAPAKVNPKNIVEIIQDFGADMAFGSPTIFSKVADYCLKEEITLPSLKSILTFGAAIHPTLMKKYKTIMPNGLVHTPYGATESLPVASINSDTVLTETAAASETGAGICVGHPVGTTNVKIIKINEDAIESFDDNALLDVGEIGEICVSGPTVTPSYDKHPEHNRMSKIKDDRQESGFWHRMGDVGYLDDSGRLWFCGRKGHRVIGEDKTHFTVQAEAIFNAHDSVSRSALIGLGNLGAQSPAIVIEPKKGSNLDELKSDLLSMASKHPKTEDIKEVFFHDAFPVDKRHNAKIHREELAAYFQK